MKKALFPILTCLLAYGLTAGPTCAAAPSTPELKQIKQQQKIQRQRLKAEQKVWKKSFHGRNIPRAERLEEEHQFQRNMRDLRLQQKDRIQQMKDQQRMMKYRQSHPLN